MDGKLNIQQVDKDTVKLEILSVIDEYMEYPASFADSVKTLVFDCERVSYINSAGLFRYVRWLNGVRTKNPNLTIRFLRLPAPFIRAYEMTAEVLPRGSKVKDFYFDFYCANCDSAKHVLAENKVGLKPPGQKCEKCKAEMQLELSVESYAAITNLAEK